MRDRRSRRSARWLPSLPPPTSIVCPDASAVTNRTRAESVAASIAPAGSVWYGGRMPEDVRYDILIRGGLLIDGSGAAPAHGDLAIRGGRIAAIGADLGDTAAKVIDAPGLAV